MDAIEKMKDEFESIERPKLQIEIPTEWPETTSSQVQPKTSSSPPTSSKAKKHKHKQDKVIVDSPSIITGKTISIAVAELDKSSEDDSAEEISEWEFDALDKDHIHHTRS